jgi:hypothetical protein
MRKPGLFKCVDCGKELPRKELNRHFRCLECVQKKVHDVVYQLHDHSGPEYEHWKEAMRARFT